MTNENKTVAERLREATKDRGCGCYPVSIGKSCDSFGGCYECSNEVLTTLADMIEAEQAELRNQSVDVAALDLLCGKLECGDANHRATAAQIRKAMKGVPSWSSLKGVLSEDKPQLPEGIEWPRFEDGELVKFGDRFINAGGRERAVYSVAFYDGCTHVSCDVCSGVRLTDGESVKRPEPEVLDADGVPIKVGDTVYSNGGLFTNEFVVEGFDTAMRVITKSPTINESMTAYGDKFTHRKPDTRESVRAEIVEAVKADYAVNLLPLFDRYEAAVLRELGGE